MSCECNRRKLVVVKHLKFRDQRICNVDILYDIFIARMARRMGQTDRVSQHLRSLEQWV